MPARSVVVTTLLFIEDDRAIHKLALRHLQKAGFDVLVAASGEEALRAAEQGIDAAVVDLGLPGISGVRVIESLRAEERTARVPIVVASGRHDVQDHALALECGADAFLVKPIDWKALESELRRLLHERGPA